MNIKLLITLLVMLGSAWAPAEDLAAHFATPPAAARPWVYWFWNNGNVTKAGITADLEAMKRAGIGGVIIMDVVERFAPPPGTADFMNAEWQELFCFAVAEAHRLGLEINMTNGPGWCGSSGPWITPEFSMQMLVATNLTIAGPSHFLGSLPQPDTSGSRAHDGFNSTVKFDDFYRDIAVLAWPETTNGMVPTDSVQELTAKLDAKGQLDWEVPAGKWTVERIGHTTTGSSTRPPVKGGNGLECDKLSRDAMDLHFTNMIGKLVAEVSPLASQALVATHIDSWESGSQNWTAKFREEFQNRRGYDLVRLLPDIIGVKNNGSAKPTMVGDAEVAARFRWDFQETISELLAENYVGRLETLSRQHGLRLTLEGYDLPFGDEATYTARADEPMTEFWATGGSQNEAKARQMASVAHIMGDRVVGAEAFTSDDSEQWRFHPATIKALGDYEFSQGVNRFVVHRYAHQPYLDRFPGATMGPWGLHYERTQTWWEMSGAWHAYLARCQYMLRQGLFVADLCYLRPELPNQTYFTPSPAVPAGYKYDECSAEALIDRMQVQDGRLVLPDGMSYGLLVLPEKETTMTPALVRKIKELVADGATVLGPRPSASPSLSGFPACDAEVVNLASEVWGDCDGKTVTEHAFGKGRVLQGLPLSEVLNQRHLRADFSALPKLNWIHRQVGGQEVYFVANEKSSAVEANCTFRVNGLRPELWNPKTGEMAPLPMYQETTGGISLPLRLEGSGSAFIVFSPPGKAFDPVSHFTRDASPVVPFNKPPLIKIQRASYGVPGDAARTRDVVAKVQTRVDGGEFDFRVAKLAEGDDPAYGTLKTLELGYTVDGQPFSIRGQDPAEIHLNRLAPVPSRTAEIRCDAGGRLKIVAAQPGQYELTCASGRTRHVEIKEVPAPQEILGAWQVHFPPNWGAPEQITLDHLISLSDATNPGVKYFSGTAIYETTFGWQPEKVAKNNDAKVTLDLGDVQVMARVQLNGQDLGILWQAPFCVEITKVLRRGKNQLKISVANLWPNRMIGDAALPEGKRFTWSSYEPFTQDTPLLKSGLIGPVMIQTAKTILLP
jgi:hypothetical protein